ncbi:MAG: sugar-binding protein [Pirellulales bacterium]
MNAQRVEGIRRSMVRRGVYLAGLGAAALWASFGGAALGQDEIIERSYSAPYTKTAPVIDGKVGSEWDAAPVTGDFLLLRTNPGEPDVQNTRWQAMWDDTALYLLVRSDYDLWSSPPSELGGLDWNSDNLNLYIDPNTDKQPNYPTDPDVIVPYDKGDGYQIAFNQWEGDSSLIGGNNVGVGGFYLEAHGGSAFGNQANWDANTAGLSSDFALSQSNGIAGGVVELKIPWTEFDADQEGAYGLKHTEAPVNNESWFFNVARITSDQSNFLPIWNWQSSQSFALRPHGDLVFVGKPSNVLPGDANADGKVDLTDFGILKANFGAGTTAAQGDFNGDAKVDLTDFGILKDNFGKSGAAAVPEPSTWLLMALGALALLGLRRRS